MKGIIPIIIILLTGAVLTGGCGASASVSPAPAYTDIPSFTSSPDPAFSPVPVFTPTPTVILKSTATPSPTPTSTPSCTPLLYLDPDIMTEESMLLAIDKMSKEILNSLELSGSENKDAALAIWKWTAENVQEGPDLNEEIKNAYAGLKDLKGGTAVKNAVFAALVENFGIEHLTVSSEDPQYNHTWNLCCIDGLWYHFDYFTPKYGNYVCFMQTDEQVNTMTISLYKYYFYYKLPEGLPERAEDPVYNGYMEEWFGEIKELLSEKEILEKLEILKSQYPTDKYWNHGGVTDIPCDHSVSQRTCNHYNSVVDRVYVHGNVSDQCRGFSNLLSDSIFGKDARVRTFANYDDLKVGDIFRIMFIPGTMRQNCHSAMVIEKYDDHVVAAEVNYDYQTCKIRWGGIYTREHLEDCHTWYISRY